MTQNYKPVRVAVSDAVGEDLQRIADVTRCGSLSAAVTLLVSRYTDDFLTWWQSSHGDRPPATTTTAAPPAPPPTTAPTPPVGTFEL